MVIKHIILTFYIVLFTSCKSTSLISDSIEGTYFKKGEDYEFTLIFKENQTFEFNKIFISHSQSSCNGKWSKGEDNTLLLKCDDIKNPSETLSSRYMNKREHIIKVINKDSIELEEGVILKKIHSVGN